MALISNAEPAQNTCASHALEARTRQRRRRITPEAGRALEILGHSIEYLADECVHCGANFNRSSAELEAIQLLMTVNRQIYFACPGVPTFKERLAGAFRTWLI